jgi:neutral amino acid transport system ATP-binding protein
VTDGSWPLTADDADVTAPGPALAPTREHLFADLAREAGVPKADPILVAEGIERRFGGLLAVDVEHLELQRGAITGLIGPNGAGKTTLFNLLTGFDKANAGTWRFNGNSLGGVPAHKVARRGMVRTFQLTKALAKMTVMDNMKLGASRQGGERFLTALVPPLWRAREREVEERAEELLARFKLDHMRDEFAGTLSGGQRKLLEMARALMSEPELIMLDEPMAGVNPALTQSLLGHIKQLCDEGLTVVFVEHDMDVVRDISDWVVVMAEGSIVAEGPHASVVADPRVIDAYLGAHHETAFDRSEQQRRLAESQARVDAEIEAERAKVEEL